MYITAVAAIIYLLLLQKQINSIDYPMCLENISKDFSDGNIKQTELNGNVYEFSVDYRNIDVDDILDIHKCFINKNNIKQCVG